MPTILIDTLVEAVAVDRKENGDQIITLQLKYTGTEDLDGQIVQDEVLKMEVPTQAPPP